MTGQTEPLSPEAAALLAEQQQAANATQPSPAADQAASAAAMTERGPVLPAESELDDFMAQMREKFDSMSAELEALKSQQQAAFVAGGGPMAVRYAQGAADKVAALVSAHPDAPRDHFAPVVQAAGNLAAEAEKLVKGTGGSAAVLQQAGAAVEKFATKTHWRTWGKYIDWSAILDDAETAVEEGLKLAA